MNDDSNPQTQAPMQKGASANTGSKLDQSDLLDTTQNKAGAKKPQSQDGSAQASARPGAASQKNLTGGTLNHGAAKDASDIDLDDEDTDKAGNDKLNKADPTKSGKDDYKNQNTPGRKA